MPQSLRGFITNHKTICIYVSIFLFSLTLRVWNLPEKMQWYNDSGRDALISHKILKNRIIAKIQPNARGGGEIIRNSPLYYYFTTLIYAIAPSPLGMAFVASVLGSLCAVIAFRISNYFTDTLSSLLIAGIIASNPALIEMSTSVYMHFFIPFFTSLVVLVFFHITTTGSKIGPYIIVLLTFISLQIHLSFGPIVPAIALAIYAVTRKAGLKTKASLLLFCLILILAWFLLTDNYGLLLNPKEVGGLMLLKQADVNKFAHFIENIRNFIQFTGLPNMNPPIAIVFSISIIILSLLPLLKLTKTKQKKVYIFLLGLGLCFFFANMYYHSTPIYFTPFYFVFPLLIAISLSSLLNSTYPIIITLKYLILATLFISSLVASPRLKHELYSVKFISQRILEDIETKALGPLDFIVTDRSDYAPGDFFSASFWYFLEEHFQKDLTRLTNIENNLEPIAQNPKIIYLVCAKLFDEQWIELVNPEARQNKCLYPFLNKYPGYKLVEQLVETVSTPLHADVYVLQIAT